MSLPAAEWIAAVGDDDKGLRFQSKQELLAFLTSVEGRATARLTVTLDRGPISGFRRFFGLKRDVVPCFTVEWTGGYASLIFLDEAWSEYRAIDRARPVDASAEVRAKISHGEPIPHPPEECMEKKRALTAIRDFVDQGGRPNWLSYRYVK